MFNGFIEMIWESFHDGLHNKYVDNVEADQSYNSNNFFLFFYFIILFLRFRLFYNVKRKNI